MKNGWLIAVASVLVIALAILATLQYRWIGEISDAETQRERDAMKSAAQHAADEIGREINPMRNAFQQAPKDALLRRYRDWSATARDPRLIASMYVVDARRGHPELFRVDLNNGALTPVAWPENFAPVRASTDAPPWQHRPFVEEIPAAIVPLRPLPPLRRERPRPDGLFPPPGRPPGRPPDRPPDQPRDQPRDQPPDRPPAGPDDRGFAPAEPSFAVLVIDRGALHDLFADISKRFLDGYEIAIADSNTVIFGAHDLTAERADVVQPLLERPPDLPRPQWRLLLRRRGATLADAAAATRRRNLAFSAAVLAILAGAFVLLAVIARRAERLRQQQLAFVAGITHELNTPIAAIESAGENLADGIVVERDHVVRYGDAIVKESRRLSDIVAQVLTYAGMQARGPRRTNEEIDVGSLLAGVVAGCAWLAEQGGVTIETSIAAALPHIDGDREELSAAIRNLIVNAIRHGGEGHWVGVRAALSGDSVLITVEDRGQGLAARDLPRLFEPFYRGRSAHARGAGLGLSIVKQIALAHGGSVSAEKRRERGAAFTLRLPVPEARHA